MSRYYQENKKYREDLQKREILAYWSKNEVYDWISNNTVPDQQLIESIVMKYQGITSTSIAHLYNDKLTPTNPLNEFIIDHIIDIFNKYKCTFQSFGNYVKKNDRWFYEISPLQNVEISRRNKYINQKVERSSKTKEYIQQLENENKKLKNELAMLKNQDM